MSLSRPGSAESEPALHSDSANFRRYGIPSERYPEYPERGNPEYPVSHVLAAP